MENKIEEHPSVPPGNGSQRAARPSEPEPEDYVISSNGFRYSVGIADGPHIGETPDLEVAERMVREHWRSKSPDFWPDVWYSSDHGNLSRYGEPGFGSWSWDPPARDREAIVGDIARTLFLIAYADGVEREEIAGDAPGGGEDWKDYAPQTDPAALRKAGEIADAFDAAVLAPSGTIQGKGLSWIQCAERSWRALVGEDIREDRFGNCVAMVATGQGVGLEDDMPSGKDCPEWIRKAIPSVEFYACDFDAIPLLPYTVTEGASDGPSWGLDEEGERIGLFYDEDKAREIARILNAAREEDS